MVYHYATQATYDNKLFLKMCVVFANFDTDQMVLIIGKAGWLYYDLKAFSMQIGLLEK